jgi:hypothetical protein
VPWCETCDRFLSPPTVTRDGTCPTCGRPVEPGQAHAVEERPEGEQAPPAEEDLGPVPFHLKFLGIALVIYLGYRFFQGVEWVIHQF